MSGWWGGMPLTPIPMSAMIRRAGNSLSCGSRIPGLLDPGCGRSQRPSGRGRRRSELSNSYLYRTQTGPMPKRQVIAMGGGGFSMEPDNPLLDAYIVAQARKKNPAVCFFPHATDDATRYALNFYKAFSRLDARPGFLSLFTPPTADLESFLLEQEG